ncbi:hypothetical protein [Streptomyces sp. ATCC 21386]|uniref:hypothetical protein n=1 Tax=Streptomyces sp. ATCC 21386 TaxID=2699428 RepID=UPI001BFF72F6|nr:hypothetical protein [Streptomyces sp. ATCC 21386]
MKEKADGEKPAKKKADDPDNVYIYAAPGKGMVKKLEDQGFQPEDFPGREFEFPDGHAYFGLGDEGLEIAQDYAGWVGYDGAVVEITIPKADFEQYFRKHVYSRNGVEDAEVAIPKELFGVLNSYPLRVMKQ